MRFLIDANLSPALAGLLKGTATRQSTSLVLAPRAPDDEVMKWALDHDHVLVSADTDFGEIHAAAGTRFPSVILFRLSGNRRAAEQADLIRANFNAFDRPA